MPSIESFPPIAAARAHVLVLGSMPGVRSLEAGQYYAHPRNVFWPIVAAVLGFDPAAAYGTRVRALKAHGVALWDVLRRCDRDGSLDSAIVAGSIRVNDFRGFLARHRRVETVLCNGGTAFTKFERLVRPDLEAAGREVRVVRLPSTSPAYAGMSRERKLEIWRRELLSAPRG